LRKGGHEPFPHGSLHMTMALLLRHEDQPACLKPVQSARCDIRRGGKLTNTEAGERAGSGELFAVMGCDAGAHRPIMMRPPIESIGAT
jgi:hypothetical protein